MCDPQQRSFCPRFARSYPTGPAAKSNPNVPCGLLVHHTAGIPDSALHLSAGIRNSFASLSQTAACEPPATHHLIGFAVTHLPANRVSGICRVSSHAMANAQDIFSFSARIRSVCQTQCGARGTHGKGGVSFLPACVRALRQRLSTRYYSSLCRFFNGSEAAPSRLRSRGISPRKEPFLVSFSD